VTPTATPHPSPAPGPAPRAYLPLLASPPPSCPTVSGQNSPSDAALLQANGQACIGLAKTSTDSEYHWYYADLGAGQTLTIDLTGVPSGADYDIYLYDKQILQTLDLNSSLRKSTKDLNADEHLALTSANGARYYLLVFLRTKSTSAPN